MPSPLPLTIQNLSVTYPAQDMAAVDNVTWSPPHGTLTGIIGPNGAGKSTLLKAVLGLISIQNGSVHYWDKSLDLNRQRVSYMAQLNDIDWDFPINVLDVVKMGLYARTPWWKPLNRDDTARARAALQAVHMTDFASRQIGQLSGGQRRRVFLARCLVQDADLYLMDEPFAGIDAKAQDIILNVLKTLKAAGKTVIVVHHDLNTIQSVFDNVLILNKRVIAHGAPEDVMTKDILTTAYGGSVIV